MILKYLALGLSWVLRAILFGASIYYVYTAQIIAAIIMIFAFIFSILPFILKQFYNHQLHWIFDLMFALLISGHMFGFMGLYEISLIYDDILHILGSFMVGVIGFMLFYSFTVAGKIRLTAPFLLLITILWTLAIGALWEIMEFMWDNIIIISSQYGFAQDSLLDTMIDLTWDLISGIFAAMVMVSFCKRAKESTKKVVFGPLNSLFSGKRENI